MFYKLDDLQKAHELLILQLASIIITLTILHLLHRNLHKFGSFRFPETMTIAA